MASALYTTQLLSVQNIAVGSSVTCLIVTDGTARTVVVRDISLYWGNPDPVLSNSAVCIWADNQAGFPSFFAYNSGVTESINPIFIHESGSWSSRTIFGAEGIIPVFRVYNTALTGGANLDVSVSGWILTGEPPNQFDFSIP